MPLSGWCCKFPMRRISIFSSSFILLMELSWSNFSYPLLHQLKQDVCMAGRRRLAPTHEVLPFQRAKPFNKSLPGVRVDMHAVLAEQFYALLAGAVFSDNERVPPLATPPYAHRVSRYSPALRSFPLDTCRHQSNFPISSSSSSMSLRLRSTYSTTAGHLSIHVWPTTQSR